MLTNENLLYQNMITFKNFKEILKIGSMMLTLFAFKININFKAFINMVNTEFYITKNNK